MGVGVPLHHELMCPANHLQVVAVNKLVTHVVSPAVAGSSRRGVKSVLAVVSWVRP